MNFLKKMYDKFLAWVRSPKAQQEIQQGMELAVEALPYIGMVADYATSGNAPAAAIWVVVKHKFPQLFDGSIKDPHQLDLYLLGAAVQMLSAAKGVPAHIAQIAVTIAFPQFLAEHPEYAPALPAPPAAPAPAAPAPSAPAA